MVRSRNLMQKFTELLFDPEESRLFHWLLYPPAAVLILCSAAFFRSFAPAGVVILLSVFSLSVFWFASSRWRTLALVGLLLFYVLLSMRSFEMANSWYRLWVCGISLSLTLAAWIMPRVRGQIENFAKKVRDEKGEKELWMQRFETLKERQKEGEKVLEGELEQTKKEQEEQLERLTAIQKLLDIAQSEAGDFARENHALMQCNEDLKKRVSDLEVEINTSQQRELEEGVAEEGEANFQQEVGDKEQEKRYTAEEVLASLSDLSCLQHDLEQLETVLEELKLKLDAPKVPFKWQQWSSEKAVKKKKQQISLGDLAKTLKT